MNELESISLNGIWVLKQENRDINIKTEVPGSIYESLIEKKVIEDPFYGLNEHDMKWIFDSDWIYEKKFNINKEQLEKNHIILQFSGIDTISEIFLNGELLGTTENMFQTYEFDIKNKCVTSDNILKVLILFKY